MAESPSVWYRLTDSSKGAVAKAVAFARSRGQQAGVADLLYGASQEHGDDSQVLVLLRYFNIPKEELYKALSGSPVEQTASASFIGSSAANFEANQDAYSTQEGPILIDSLNQEAELAIMAGLKLAEQYNHTDSPPLVRLRDLVGALLMEPTSAQSILRGVLSSAAAWAHYDTIVGVYQDYLEQGEKQPLWEVLSHKLTRPNWETSLRRAISGFGPDARASSDLIGIGAEIDAFAYLITARAMQPPLAIGLFGDWGSGKTYFMQSLRERVHKITEEARQSKKPQKSIAVYKYVVQIEFNAWHYVEGELWASLVQHIFDHLQTQEGEGPTLLEERQRVWAQKMEDSRRAQREIEQRKQELQHQLDEKQQKKEELARQCDEKLEEMNQLKARDALNDVKLTPDQKEKIDKTLQDMGISAAGNSAVDFYNALNELRKVLEEGKSLGLLLHRRGAPWTLRLVLVLISGPVISGLIAWLSQNQFPAVTNALLGVSAFLSSATVVLRQGTSEMSNMLVRVKTAQSQLDDERRRVENEYATRIQEIERQIAPIQEQYQKVVSEEQTLAIQVAELEKEATQITPRRVLLDFIRERVGSQDYRKWLGIPALIRRDFDQLSRLIEDSNKNFVGGDDGAVKEEDRHNINRIVLYIDDLDRCPPDKVAKVLQAVHLLLAFPLFVVVVAVDARWLAQSLHEYYKGLLADNKEEDEPESEDTPARATPQDYLEKIFQVPFWVQSLSEDARLSIVQGLVEESLVQLNKVDKDTGQPAGKEGVIDQIAGKTNRHDRQAAQGAAGTPAPVFYEPKPQEPLSTTPPGLEIEVDELKFMESLKPLLGLTPRSVRRFVNIYWLLKSIALARPQARPFIQAGNYPDYQQVMFLLAVLTGLPGISHEFFSLLCPVPMKGMDKARCPQETLGQVVETLRTSLEKRQARGIQNLSAVRDLDRLHDWACTSGSAHWADIPTSSLSYWAPQVARFSYRMEHV